MQLRLFAPRYWLTWAGVVVLRLLAFLPYPALLALGRALGSFVRQLPTGWVQIARRNLELCLPELTPSERERLLREHFASLGIGLMEIPLAWWASTKRIARLVQVEGLEHLRAAQAEGRGVMVLTAHFTLMEMAGRTLGQLAPMRFLYRPTKNEALTYIMDRRRRGFGSFPIPRDDIRAFVTALRRGEVVWYAPDQSYRHKGAEMVPWFGIPAATNTLTPRLARTTGARVLPFFLQRLPGTRGYRAVIHPPLENYPSDDPLADTERFNHLIEAQVRQAPEQYLWIHRRFKGLSADYPNYYAREAPRRA
jgi:Kdo2-lipid IVA lauroyltransferase/acyltransferase